MIEIDESDELVELALGMGLRKIMNGLNFLRDWGNTMMVNLMFEKNK